MNIQFVRLDSDLIERVNEIAKERGEKVSDMVNEIVRTYLRSLGESSSHRAGS